MSRLACRAQGDLDFDGLLQFCIELQGKLDLDQMLRLAEALCLYAGDAGRDCVAGLAAGRAA